MPFNVSTCTREFMVLLNLFIFFSVLKIEVVVADNELGVMFFLTKAYPEWKPRGIVDVGANVGGWTTGVQTQYYPGVNTFMVEASPKHTEILEKVKKQFAPNVDFKIAVMSENDGDSIEFYSTVGKGTGDSMFVENSHHYTDIQPVVRTSAKLDTLVQHMDHIDYLKVDVQGAELMVLSGATETLKRATFVQMEVSVIEYNKGGACWFDLDDLLRQHGFYLYDMHDFIRIPHAFHTKGIGQFDTLYVKPTSPYLPPWLNDNNAKLCGSSTAAEEKEKLISKNVRSMADHTTVSVRYDFNQPSYVFAFLMMTTFFAGYVIGIKREKERERERKRPTRKRENVERATRAKDPPTTGPRRRN
eukprot:CAMPEP_0170774644 /NCGR_PEP_ID=MMETSP0733-20121128/10076_1 /TAXON_ID=186038 /ORGANISM="Fragilariopsis kerguelensis, Strain L26-C5" /LENGTH=358 /DNA_ID=CAMNT_0011117231 /DNA_START=365 /DNA_END=1441 /DNA_ORIENTATION=+